MNCPYCHSEHTKKLSAIYQAGTTVSSGTGFAIGSQPGQFGTVNTTIISRTIDAENAKAPEKMNYSNIFVALIVWIVPMIGLGMVGSRFVPVPFLLAMAYVIYQFPAIYHQRNSVYPELMRFYSSSSKCMKCHATFQENFEWNPAIYDWSWKKFIHDHFLFTKTSVLLMGIGAAFALYPFVLNFVLVHSLPYLAGYFFEFSVATLLITSGVITAKNAKLRTIV
ncbi:hypothetical protein H8K47_15330 [Undibacterium sp. CY7W]|uniref:Uncharacterized protein n=1 Tax=Undibacterium rugosum TaxID=2762291 RepID=A0A923KU53_9BURK|nr:hypothetical protein [Undibacterium rugosum]MBC3936739.1 hypothetical protein [Undibacterium rugosum]